MENQFDNRLYVYVYIVTSTKKLKRTISSELDSILAKWKFHAIRRDYERIIESIPRWNSTQHLTLVATYEFFTSTTLV